MNYELAKELKDAGFPQTLGMGGHYYTESTVTHKVDGSVLRYRQNNEPEGDDVKAPTLSELIEACGPGFKALQFVLNKNIQMEWVADALNIEKREPATGTGYEPEEAVARLWLVVNKKYGN